MSVEIDEKDYCSTIISSLSIHLSNFILNQLTVARLYAPTKTIDPDALISLITEESDHQCSQCACRGNDSGKAKGDEKDKALSVTQGQLPKGKGGSCKLPRGVCWNCGEKGHFKNKCPKSTKKDEDSLKNGGTANAAIASDSEGEGAFFMEPESNTDSDLDLPNFETVSVSNGESKGGYGADSDDWFSEVGGNEADSGEDQSVINWSKCGSSIEVDLNLDATKPNEITIHINAGNADIPCIKIHDSSCSKHLMLYQDAFKNFVEISPKLFCAMNKQKMDAIGMDKIVIDASNGANVSKLRLIKVLYSSEVGYTLVFIGKLDNKGFKLTFSGRKCTICGSKRKHIGTIPKAQ